MKKALFLCIDGLTDPLGQSQIIPYLQGLSRNGYKVHILSAEKPKQFSTQKEAIREALNPFQIKWDHISYGSKIPLISTFFNYQDLKKSAIRLSQKEGFDIIHARSLMPAMIGMGLKNKFGSRLIFDMRGFWADERVDGRLWSLGNPIFRYLYRYFKRAEKKAFESADYIISLTESGREYIAQHFQTKDNFQVIPCAADFQHFDPTILHKDKIQRLKNDLGINDEDYVLTYVGSLGTRYRLKEMLQFFSILKEKQPNARFLFITKNEPSPIFQKCEELKIDPTSIIVRASTYQEIPAYIALGNASIFFIVTSFSGKAVSPTKQAEVLGMGIPIVANVGLGDTDRILRKSKAGVLLESYSSKALEEAAEELLHSHFTKEAIRKKAIQYFALEKAVDKYTEVYQNL